MNPQTIGDLLTNLRALEQRKLRKDLYVNNEVRARFLLEHNNRFTSRAVVHEVEWKNVGSGVWKANIKQ